MEEVEIITSENEVLENVVVDNENEIENFDVPVEDSVSESEDLSDEFIEAYKEDLAHQILSEYLKNNTGTGDFDVLEVQPGIDGPSVSDVDYSTILADLFDSSEDIHDALTEIIQSNEDFDSNNNLQADVNDISLTNMLLLLIAFIMLFNGLIDFARRIF